LQEPLCKFTQCYNFRCQTMSIEVSWHLKDLVFRNLNRKKTASSFHLMVLRTPFLLRVNGFMLELLICIWICWEVLFIRSMKKVMIMMMVASGFKKWLNLMRLEHSTLFNQIIILDTSYTRSKYLLAKYYITIRVLISIRLYINKPNWCSKMMNNNK